MIHRNRVKLAVATLVLAASVIAALGALAWGAQLHRAVLSGASPEDVFTPIPAIPAGLDPEVTWRADLPTPREVEPTTRSAVQETWTGALARLDLALQTGATQDLPTNFSGAALEQVLVTIAGRQGPSRQVPSAHELQVTFYSDDGSILTLTDHRLVLHRELAPGGDPVDSIESWDVVLLLRDGRWRVEHLVRTASEVCTSACGATSTLGTTLRAQDEHASRLPTPPRA